MRASLRVLLVILVSGVILGGCFPRAQYDLRFNPQERLRVMVLPFTQPGSEDSTQPTPQNSRAKIISSIDGIVQISEGAERLPDENPSATVQRAVERELAGTAFEVIAGSELQRYVTTSAASPAIGYPPTSLQEQQALCQEVGCDAWLTGEIQEWSQRYFGIQTIIWVKIHLEIIRAQDSTVVFSSTAEEYDARGVTRGVTGYPALVVEPLRGLASGVIRQVAQRTVRTVLGPLYLDARPDSGGKPPMLIRAAHSGTIYGDESSAKVCEPLLVVAEGDPGLLGTFSIGTQVLQLPLLEISPGHYSGEYLPTTGEALLNQPVSVSLRDAVGRRQELVAGPGLVSSCNR